MSRYLATVLAATLLMGVAAGPVWAQDDKPAEEGNKPTTEQGEKSEKGKKVDSRFAKFDVAPQDNVITLSEYTAGKSGPAREALVKTFNSLDTKKGDGGLTEEEFLAGETDYGQLALRTIIVLAVVVLPFLVGSYLGRMLQMPEYGWRLGAMLFAVTVGLVLVIGGWREIKLGPDLRGGVILVYEIDKQKRIGDVRPKVISEMATAIGVAKDKRIEVLEGENNLIEVRLPAERRDDVVGTIEALEFDKYGAQLKKVGDRQSADRVLLVYEMTLDDFQPAIVRQIAEKVGAKDSDDISVVASGASLVEVTVPQNAAEGTVEEVKNMDFGQYGAVLEETSRADEDGKVVITFEIKVDAQDIKMGELVSEIARRINPGGIKEVAVRKRGNEQVEIIVPGVEGPEVDKIRAELGQAGAMQFRIVPNMQSDNSTGLYERALQAKGNTVFRGEIEEARWVKLGDGVRSDGMMKRPGKKGGEEVLVLLGNPEDAVYGSDLARASAGFDDSTLSPAVFFQMKAAGATKFGRFTSSNLKRTLGIVLDEELLSAATIQSQITSSGQITGDFTQERVDFIVGILNSGQLSSALNPQPISQEVIGPQLGEATVKSATYAMALSLIVVLIFMLVYYHFSGILACLALVLNILLVLAVMIAVGYEFTLAGLAGLVLTVGMAVDANVLIFERIREERNRGAALRMAIRNGFSKATTTIVDANLTTLITAIVLFWIGTEQVKGFAVTLILGITMSMFTAIFCSRVIFDIAERKKIITKLTMLRILGATNINFIGKRFVAGCLSLILITIGLVATYDRGKGLLDIDFTGGSSVTVYFEEGKGMPVEQVRKTMKESGLPDVQVSRQQIAGEPDNLRYKIDTSDRNLKQVQKRLLETFPDRLRTIHMKHENVVAVVSEIPDFTIPPVGEPKDETPKDDDPKDEEPKDGEPKDSEPKDGEPKGEEPTDGEPKDGEPKDGEPKDGEPKDEEPTDGEPKDGEPKDAEPTDGEPKDGEPKDGEPKEPEKTGGEEKPAEPGDSGESKAGESESASGDGEKTDGEAGDAEKPAEGDGASRSSLPALPLPLATQLTLLQTDEADGESTDGDDAPKDDEPKEDEPKEEGDKPTDADQPTDADAPKEGDEPKDGDDKPEEGSSVTKPEDDLPPEPKDTGAAPPDLGSNPFSKPEVGASVKLSFSEKISNPSLQEVVEQASKTIPSIAPGQLTAEFSNKDFTIGSSIGYKQWTMTTNLDVATTKKLVDAMTDELSHTPIFPSTSNIGERVSGDMKWKAIAALAVSLIFIVAYIWVRFQNVVFGLAAVVALVHDVLITLGFLAISLYLAPFLGFLQIEPFKISLPIVAAFLTIIGYSLNDTIVVFDRIREVRGKSPTLTEDVVNTSINQTLSRTLLTSLTTLIVVSILYFFGGPGIHAFAFALVVGVMVGTYSSIFVASPALLAMMKRQQAAAAAQAGGGATQVAPTP